MLEIQLQLDYITCLSQGQWDRKVHAVNCRTFPACSLKTGQQPHWGPISLSPVSIQEALVGLQYAQSGRNLGMQIPETTSTYCTTITVNTSLQHSWMKPTDWWRLWVRPIRQSIMVFEYQKHVTCQPTEWGRNCRIRRLSRHGWSIEHSTLTSLHACWLYWRDWKRGTLLLRPIHFSHKAVNFLKSMYFWMNEEDM